MKNLMIILVFILTNANLLKADLGSCVYYQAKFYLKDGTVFNGGFEYGGYNEGSYLNTEDGTNKFCNDKGIFELLKKLQKQSSQRGNNAFIKNTEDFGKIWIYKQFNFLSPTKRNESFTYYQPTYGFVSKENIVYLDSTDIERMVFWDAKYTKREWLTSEIVIGNQGMIDTISNEKYWNAIHLDLDMSKPDSLVFNSEGSMWGYDLINYNSKINEQELIRLAKFKLSFLTNSRKFYHSFKAKHGLTKNEIMNEELRRKASIAFERKIQRTRDWLWKKGIVMIRVNGTC